MWRPPGWVGAALLGLASPALLGFGSAGAERSARTGPKAEVVGTEDASHGATSVERTRQHAAAAFYGALTAFRCGESDDAHELRAAASRLRDVTGRDDPLTTANFFTGLSNDERAQGIELENALDSILERLAELDATPVPGAAHAARTAAIADLEDLAHAAIEAADPTPAAYALSLLARMDIRQAEAAATDDRGVEPFIDRAEARARQAVRRFARAGYLTPQLEPLWVLARAAHANRDAALAEQYFTELERTARATGRLEWRERALVGHIGIDRDRGDLAMADEHLRSLATFRSPSTSWSLAREVGIQLLSNDDANRALRWLLQHPPTDSDAELMDSVGTSDPMRDAQRDWRTLIGAAEVRAGRTVASARLFEGLDEHGQTSEVLRLARAALAIDTARPEDALEILRSRAATSEVGRAEALTLTGRAYLALDRPRDAIAPLQQAVSMAKARDQVAALRASSSTASQIGEWLGISTVEWLARAHAELGDPWAAAGAIEAAYSGASPESTEAALRAAVMGTAPNRVPDRMNSRALGAVTWIVGADATLAVYLRPDGGASTHSIPHGRRAIRRAVERVGAALEGGALQPVVREVSAAILPPELCDALCDGSEDGARTASGRTLILFPHGPLERLAFEALPVGQTNERLGLIAAVQIADRLRTDRDPQATPFAGTRTEWRAFGAPTSTALDALPWSARELETLDSLHPRMQVTAGSAFTRDALLAAIDMGHALHVASHVVEGSLGGPHIVASDGESLSREDLLRIRPALPVAVLATCSSGDGQAFEGRGLAGIGQAFLDGGTGAVVVTQRPVQDAVAYRASTLLHAALLTGASVPEAARRAREALAQSGASLVDWSAYRALARP